MQDINTGYTQHRLLETFIQLATFDPAKGQDRYSEPAKSADDIYIDESSYMTVIDISEPHAIRYGFIDEEWDVKDANELAEKRCLAESLAKEVAKWAIIQQDTINVFRDTDVTPLFHLSAKDDCEGPHLKQITYSSRAREEADEG